MLPQGDVKASRQSARSFAKQPPRMSQHDLPSPLRGLSAHGTYHPSLHFEQIPSSAQNWNGSANQVTCSLVTGHARATVSVCYSLFSGLTAAGCGLVANKAAGAADYATGFSKPALHKSGCRARTAPKNAERGDDHDDDCNRSGQDGESESIVAAVAGRDAGLERCVDRGNEIAELIDEPRKCPSRVVGREFVQMDRPYAPSGRPTACSMVRAGFWSERAAF
jgi:hypothetical protein